MDPIDVQVERVTHEEIGEDQTLLELLASSSFVKDVQDHAKLLQTSSPIDNQSKLNYYCL